MSDKRERVRRMDMGPCALCSRPARSVYGGGAVRLADGGCLCGDCVRRLRFLYPLSPSCDPLTRLDAGDARSAMNGALDRLEEGEGVLDECRQLALYDDELKKALALLRRVKAVHAAAIRNGDAAVSALTSRLLYDIDKLEGEI